MPLKPKPQQPARRPSPPHRPAGVARRVYRPPERGRRQAPRPAFRAAVLVPCVLVIGLMIGLGDQTLLLFYGVMTALTALLFWLDKKQAIAGRGRVSERTLLTFSFLGGWPGALIVGQMIRHKTQKLGFRVPLWIIVALHVGLWVWLAAHGQTLMGFLQAFIPA